MKFFVFLTLAATFSSLFSSTAHAQYQRTNWWEVSYDFVQIKNSEDNSSEVGHVPTLNGQVGVAFTPSFAMSLTANYGTDSLAFSGTNLLGTTTNAWVPVTLLEARVDGLLMYQEFFFNLGYGYRDFADAIPGQYSRTIRTTFLPIGVYYLMPPFYLHGEYRRYISGDETIRDLGASRQDVTLSQGGGGCYALEAAWMVQRPLGIKVSLQYAIFNLDGSNAQSDGVEVIAEPSMQSTEISLGLGLIF